MTGYPPPDNFAITPLGEGGAPAPGGAYNNNYGNNYGNSMAPPPPSGDAPVQYGGVSSENVWAKPSVPPSAMPAYGVPMNFAPPPPPAPQACAGATADVSPAQLERNKRSCPQCRGAGCELCAWGYRDTTLLCRQCRGSGCASCSHTGQSTVYQQPASAPRPPAQGRAAAGGHGGGGGCSECHNRCCHGNCGKDGSFSANGRRYYQRPRGHPANCQCEPCRNYRAYGGEECALM